jgi:RimJ/RimL family protein N-acetyltransferase
LAWFKDPDIKRFILAKPKTVSDLKRRAKAWQKNPNVLAFAIVLEDRPAIAGTMKLERHENDDGDSWADLGLLLGPDFRRQGIGTEAIRHGVAAAYQAWPRLRSVVAGIHARNWPSLKAFEKAGFTIDYPERLWATWTPKGR